MIRLSFYLISSSHADNDNKRFDLKIQKLETLNREDLTNIFLLAEKEKPNLDFLNFLKQKISFQKTKLWDDLYTFIYSPKKGKLEYV